MSRPSWILFTTLSIIHLAYTTVPPATTMTMEQSPLHVVVSQNAEISCNYTSQKELNLLKISLLKGVEKRVHVCSYSWNTTSNATKTERDFNCWVDFAKKQNKTTFHLQNLHVNQTDIYICKIEDLYPPPYEASVSHNGTLIHVKGVSEVPVCQCHQHGLEYMLMIAAIIIFIVYSVTVTAACYYCWRKAKKNRIVRNDYFNMTPWQSNGVKKRQLPQSVPARNYTAYRSWEP
ncbi:T-cell-specific surface glycoprotein CD28 isoform X2 [Anolis carolinensis]|uniref:CD28 molecule n=1 Tax=Anolis carolinensis TaxID=28377 RepID=H9G932_ANOCA|nr:PREDICTED: T-cell-specific surface glycoprotein CD28 isoform X1 [Anolis carolinensis]|eukprot:XP_003223584.1 PREDICTED: T-cell-specific surface glycoprotein CD28 isoform X1 [Anolis carolinensis]